MKQNHVDDSRRRQHGRGGINPNERKFEGIRAKPVETSKEYDVSITEISRKGDGIARVEGFVIFVKDGKAGMNAKVRITQVGQRFAAAELVGGTIIDERPIIEEGSIIIRGNHTKIDLKPRIKNINLGTNLVTKTIDYAKDKGLQIGPDDAEVIIETSKHLHKDIERDAEMLSKKNNISKSEARLQIIKRFTDYLKKQ